MRGLRYLWTWPWANIRYRRWMSACTVLGVALVVGTITTLMGFVGGYEQAVRRDVDRMGVDLLITARGCPYEAATLMLRGGEGLQYIYDDVVAQLDAEPEVVATHPSLVVAVRDSGQDSGTMLLKGVELSLQEARGLTLREGRWLGEDTEGVVLGYEAAELELRHAGDAFLIPGSSSRDPIETQVLGVLERTGTQLDGMVLLRLDELQARTGMEDQISAVGVEVDPAQPGAMDALQERYESDPTLQVIRLSSVVQSLDTAMERMRGVVGVLSAVLALVAGAFLLQAGLLRSLAEHRQNAVLRAVGLPLGFILGAGLLENLILIWGGALCGLLLASLAGPQSSAWLTEYLPYRPGGDLVLVSLELAIQIGVASVILAVLATLPAWIRLRFFTGIDALRGA